MTGLLGELVLDESAKARLVAVFGETWWEREVDEETLEALTESALTRAKVKLAVALEAHWGGRPSELERRALDEIARGVRP